MRIHNMGEDVLSDWDYQALKDQGLEEVWYHYICGDYEGSGKLLATRAGKWFVLDMGHCSCNGPLENLSESLRDPFDSLESIRSKSSRAYWDELNNLLLGGMINQMGF